MGMKKTVAIQLFGSQSAVGRALGVTPQAICQWPAELDQNRADRVRGAALRHGLDQRLVELLAESDVRHDSVSA